jgi:hypothetical protein
MHIILQRLTTNDSGTFGVLIINNKPCFVTLEPPWKDNQNNISCIPPGTYHATKMYSEKFSKQVYVLHDVPNRDLIEFHIGNLIKDTHGCILLGTQFSMDLYMINNSQTAFDKFMIVMPLEGFTVTIKDIIVVAEDVWV